MSGWIKLEKDLLTDPRFLRLSKWYEQQKAADGVTHDRYSRNACAYQVLGMLSGIWIYADTHIDENDHLNIEPDALDEVIGMKGFSEAIHWASDGDWLQIERDTGRVILPGYQAHNGMEAKARALTAKRVSNHRKRTTVTVGQLERLASDTSMRNAPALPDHTRPDQTEKKVSNETSKKRIDREQALSAALSTPGLNRDAFVQFIEYRSTVLRDPVKTPSLVKLAQKLAGFGPVELQMTSVQESMTNDWQGIFAPKLSAQPALQQRESAGDFYRRRMTEIFGDEHDEPATSVAGNGADVRP